MSKILENFLELEMLTKDGEVYVIKNWNKYQRTVSAMSAEAEFNKKADEYLAKKKN